MDTPRVRERVIPAENETETRHQGDRGAEAGHAEDSAETSKATHRKVEQGIPRHEELSDETPS